MHGVCLFHCFVLLPVAEMFFSGSIIADSFKNHSGIFLLDTSSEGPSLTTPLEVVPQQLIASRS